MEYINKIQNNCKIGLERDCNTVYLKSQDLWFVSCVQKVYASYI